MPYGRAALAPDTTYATVRSYSRSIRRPSHILEQACKEGNIQAVIKGLKLYPELRTQDRYVHCWNLAAENGHVEIAWLFWSLLEGLPYLNYFSLSLRSAVKSRSLDVLKKLLETLNSKDRFRFLRYLELRLVEAYTAAVADNQDEMLEELSKHGITERMTTLKAIQDEKYAFNKIRSLVEAAGASGQYGKVELVLDLLSPSTPDQEEIYYNLVLIAAAKANHPALVKQIAPSVSTTTRLTALREAIVAPAEEVARYLIEDPSWSVKDLVDLIPLLIGYQQDELLEDVLERVEGNDWSLSQNILRDIVAREDEGFLPLAERLLQHASLENLKHLRFQLKSREDHYLFWLVNELLEAN